MLHAIWVRHHLRPGEFWRLPRGEQLFLMASMELELEAENMARKEAERRGWKRVLQAGSCRKRDRG